jgi:hypothetical protein
LNSAGPIDSESHPLTKTSLHLDATTRMLAYHMHAQVMAGYAPSSAPRAGRAMGTSALSSCHVAAQPRHQPVTMSPDRARSSFQAQWPGWPMTPNIPHREIVLDRDRPRLPWLSWPTMMPAIGLTGAGPPACRATQASGWLGRVLSASLPRRMRTKVLPHRHSSLSR